MYLRELARVAIANGEPRVKVSSTINPMLRAFYRPSGIVNYDEYNEYKKGPGRTIEDFLEEYPEERWPERFPSLIPNWGPERQQYFKYLLKKYYVVDIKSDHEDYRTDYDIGYEGV